MLTTSSVAPISHSASLNVSHVLSLCDQVAPRGMADPVGNKDEATSKEPVLSRRPCHQPRCDPPDRAVCDTCTWEGD
jgi:hypothetical protein